MAVVAEYRTDSGVTVRILDDAIAGVGQEEMERRIREVQRTAWRIAENEARRQRAALAAAEKEGA
ncbi:MAG: hypothetical protein IJT62_05675 [Oscillospiraceae bacterium]|nr:hypothetical protein [Oscillospiraceae bacterium]